MIRTFDYRVELKKLIRKIDKDVKTIAKKLKEYHDLDASLEVLTDDVYSDLIEELNKKH
jgi:hypothetical protein